jgi:hypothetical protein
VFLPIDTPLQSLIDLTTITSGIGYLGFRSDPMASAANFVVSSWQPASPSPWTAPHVTFITPSWQPTSPSLWVAPHATFVTPSWQPASLSPWAPSPANFVTTSWTLARPSPGTTPNFVTSSSLTACPSPWATPLGAATTQQSPAPSTGDLWTNIRADLAKMQATLQKVKQGLLQIKAAVQHGHHQLALSARLQTSAAVGIQVVARGFLARQRVREMRQRMLEAALVTVDLGTRGRDLALSDGHQQRHRAAISKSPSASMVRVPRATNFNSTAAAVGNALPSSSTRAHYLAPPHSATGRHESASAGYCCDLFQVPVHVLPFRLDGVHGIQVAAHVQVQCAEGVRLILWGQKKHIRNNKISRDVKGLSSRFLVLSQVDSVFEHRHAAARGRAACPGGV